MAALLVLTGCQSTQPTSVPTAEKAKATETVVVEEPTIEVATEEPTTEIATDEPIVEAVTEKPVVEVTTDEPTVEVVTEEPTTEATAENSTEAKNSDIVAVVEGEPVSKSDFIDSAIYIRSVYINQYYQYLSYYSMYGQTPDSTFNDQFNAILADTDEAKQTLGENALNQAIFYKMLDLYAAENNIEVTDDEIREFLRKNLIAEETETATTETTDGTEGTSLSDTGTAEIGVPEIESDKEAELDDAITNYLTSFSEGYLSEEAFYKSLRASQIIDKYLGAQIFEEEMVSARHILVADKETAEEVLKKLDEGESWNDLAAEYSTDTANKDNGGDLGWFARGQMVQAFEDAAFALEPGEISDPVETSYGFHIIASDGKEVRPLEGDALSTAQDNAYSAFREELFAKYKYETYDNWMDSVPTVPEFTPIDFDALATQAAESATMTAAANPTQEVTTEPSVETTTEVTTEPTIEPTTEPSAEPTTEATTEVTSEPEPTATK